MKEITKFEKTSLNDFKLHTEESQEKRFFSRMFVPPQAAWQEVWNKVPNID